MPSGSFSRPKALQALTRLALGAGPSRQASPLHPFSSHRINPFLQSNSCSTNDHGTIGLCRSSVFNSTSQFGAEFSLLREEKSAWKHKSSLFYCQHIRVGSENWQQWRCGKVSKCLCSNATVRDWKSYLYIEPAIRENIWRPFLVRFYSDAASDMSSGGAPGNEQVNNSVVSSDQTLLGDRTLKLVSGSCYLPHPDKEETGGEDAHFVCVDEQAIGVADGVGGWADLGVNAGNYAKELMSHSVSAIQEEPKGSVDPARVLEKAYLSTKAKGSSTACIIALTDKGIRAVNLGDSGFIIIRNGSTVFRSPVQQHDFNFTYQLESGNSSDLPSAAQVFTFPVVPGDVIVAGTDGLFDNLYNNEITAIVVHAIRAGLEPQATAQKIAALARQRAQDKNRQTPFSTAAQDAGYRYYGGKLDDITVVVSYVTASSP